jgi:NAD(P)-dependent dehydrogenase (short-subunit alcohol dehydrogenase family)
VTGASSGIGNATAKLFAHERAKVVVLHSASQNSRNSLRKLARKAMWRSLAGDLQSEEFAKAFVATAVRRLGGMLSQQRWNHLGDRNSFSIGSLYRTY